MFKIIRLTLVAISLSPLFVLNSAQALDKQFNEVREKLEAKREKLIQNEIKLNKNHNKKFMILYKEYRNAVSKIDNDTLNVTENYAKLYNSNAVTNENAAALMTQYLDLEERRFNLKKQYIQKFSQEFPAKIVWKLFHLEDNINTQIKNAYIDQIPLVN